MIEERVQAYLTNGSPLTGKKIVTSAQRKVEAYLGIPYGKPPVNELRFSGNNWHECRLMRRFASIYNLYFNLNR